MTRKYKLTVNNTTVDVEVDGPSNGVLTISLGESTFPVRVTPSDTDSGTYTVNVGDKKHTLHLISNPNTDDFTIKIKKNQYSAHLRTEMDTLPRTIQPTTALPTPSTKALTTPTPRTITQEPTEPGTVTAPLPGRVLEVRVKESTIIKQGDVLLVLEAMKMANEFRAPLDGTVATVHVEAGTAVEKGQPMITLK